MDALILAEYSRLLLCLAAIVFLVRVLFPAAIVCTVVRPKKCLQLHDGLNQTMATFIYLFCKQVLLGQIYLIQSMPCQKNVLGSTAWVISGLFTACYSIRPTHVQRELRVLRHKH